MTCRLIRWTLLDRRYANFPTFSHDSRFIYYLHSSDDSVDRVPVSGGTVERILDLKSFRGTGWMNGWFGLDPDDAPLLLRDAGSDEIYALTLKRK